jgi:uncharacterized DUF497 family protein
MTYEWDENKRNLNKIKHGLDFVDAILVFNDQNRIDKIDNRRDYGETRRIVTGIAKQNIITVVYTIRGEAIRIISSRLAKKKERSNYGNC